MHDELLKRADTWLTGSSYYHGGAVLVRDLTEAVRKLMAERDAALYALQCAKVGYDSLVTENERVMVRWSASQDFVTGLIHWAQQSGLPAVVKKANELGEKYNATLNQ